MADIKYRGEFTLRNNDTDIPARIEVYTGTGSVPESDIKPMSLGADPVVITWDKTELTDCIHPSQMMVSMIATEDGQYRDLVNAGTIRGVLSVQDGGSWRPWWRGSLAQLTWEEPFSRKQNYDVSITFSDFGYLSRITFKEELLNAVSVRGGTANMEQLLSVLLSRVLYDAGVEISDFMSLHEIHNAEIGESSFSDLMVRTDMCYEDGEGRPVRDIIEDILAPCGAHIIQHSGRMHVFSPDYYTYKEGVSALTPYGADAMLTTAETYNKVELTYDQVPSDVVAKITLDAEDTGYEGPWQYATSATLSTVLPEINDADSDYFICGEKYQEGRKGYKANYISGQVVTPCLWLVNGYDKFFLPPGYTKPDSMPTSYNESGMLNLSLSFPVSSAKEKRQGEYPLTKEKYVKVTLPVFVRAFFYSGTELKAGKILDIHMEMVASFYPSDPTGPTLFLSKTGWVENMEGGYPTMDFKYSGSSMGADDYYKDGEWSDLVGFIPSPQCQGLVVVNIYPNQTRFDFDVSYTSNIYMFAVRELEAKREGAGVEEKQASFVNMLTRTLNQEAEDFSKEFAMGTPVLLTLDTTTGFTAKDYTEEVSANDTYLSRYMNFMERNFSLNGHRQRWRISGSYRYDHLSGLPVFDAKTSIPLNTLPHDEYAFFPRMEEWHVRRGMSSLEIEEANVAFYKNGPFVTIYPDFFTVPAKGGTFEFTVVSNVVWQQGECLLGDAVLSMNPASGKGTTKVSVTFPENKTFEQVAGALSVIFDNGGVQDTAGIFLGQEAAEPYLNVSPSSVEVSGLGVAVPVTLDTNIPDISVIGSDAWITTTRPETDRIDIGAQPRTGRLSEGRSGHVDISGMGLSARVDVAQLPIGLYLEVATDADGIIPAEQAGGTVSIVMATNASEISLVFIGASMTAAKRLYYTDPQLGQQEIASTSASSLSAEIPGDPGAAEAFAVLCEVDLPANTSGVQKNTVVTVVGISGAEDTRQSVTVKQQA